MFKLFKRGPRGTISFEKHSRPRKLRKHGVRRLPQGGGRDPGESPIFSNERAEQLGPQRRSVFRNLIALKHISFDRFRKKERMCRFKMSGHKSLDSSPYYGKTECNFGPRHSS